jgi:hypothetical protein
MVAPAGSDGGVLLAPDERDSWPVDSQYHESMPAGVVISSLYCDSDTLDRIAKTTDARVALWWGVGHEERPDGPGGFRTVAL